jgi:glycosyltransferase involved in cell wall biosynthesis
MRLYLVIPCYNEEDALPETARRLREKLAALVSAGKISPDSRCLFVDDGSRDATWQIIARLHSEDKLFSGLRLSGNRGHQNALLAGLMAAKDKAGAVISLDADLQDDINAIDKMLKAHEAGAQIVYGVRSARKNDSRFKRGSARIFYRMMAALGVNIVYDHADYRLMSRAALEGLANFREVNLFLRGIVPLLGFKTSTVEYERGERLAGESKYPLKKMISFALDGITSFSAMPIRFITLLGFLIFLVSIAFTLYTIAVKFFGFTVPGWSTLMASIWILGGLQLLALGIIGEYAGKIYIEVKARPRYIVEEILDE